MLSGWRAHDLSYAARSDNNSEPSMYAGTNPLGVREMKQKKEKTNYTPYTRILCQCWQFSRYTFSRYVEDFQRFFFTAFIGTDRQQFQLER